ncbi:hypothetical protein Btru_075498, partial [Bulinus truncatus]
PNYGEDCNSSAAVQCDGGYQCLPDIKNNITRCLCNSTEYWTDSNLCKPVSSLIEIKTNVSSTNSIEFTWTVERKNATINIYNGINKVVSTQPTGYNFNNLTSGTLYNFTFHVTIPPDDYYALRNGTPFDVSIWTRPAYGDRCDLKSLPCDSGSYCVEDVNNFSRCLCNDTQYRTNSKQCAALDSLTVSGVVNASSTNSVNFTWSNSLVNNDKAKFQIFNGNNPVIQADYNGGKVENLASGTKYTFIISVFIPNDTYYRVKTGPNTTVTAWTEPLYGDECVLNPFSCETGTVCIKAVDNFSRCLCNVTQYRSNKNQCVEIENFKVSNVTYVSTTESVALKWLSNNINIDNPIFLIYNGPNVTTIQATNTGANVTNLSHGASYNFSIVVKTPNDKYYAEKSGPSVSGFFWTVPAYLDQCGSNPNFCDSGAFCIGDVRSVNRCLCNQTHYRTKNDKCIEINTNLKVSDIGNTSSTNSVNLIWSSTSIENDNATFLIQYGNSSAIIASSSGRNISQLQSGTHYNFSIVVIIPNDTYNVQKIGPYSYVTTWTVPNYGDECGSNPYFCDGGFYCVKDVRNVSRCLCNETQYRTNRRLCAQLDSLTISNVTSVSTTNSVNFTWVSSDVNHDNTTFQFYNETNGAIQATSTGGIVTNLKSGTQYTFTILVKIPSDTDYPTKSHLLGSVTVWTVSEYGEKCGLNLACVSGTFCIKDMTNVSRCLCNETQYRTNSNQCVQIENLKVSNVTNISTTTSVNFNWSSIDINNDNATFYINNGSYGMIPATNTWGFVANLSSGTQYTFKIVAMIPDDTYYANKSGPPVNVTVWTVPVYGDLCANNSNCLSGSECLKDKNQILRCICNESQYRADNGTCLPIGSLQVINTNIVRTTTSVTINWTSSHINRNTANFTILTGSQNYPANTTGGTVDKLVPGSQYSFNITVTIPEDSYYTTKIGLPTNVSFWTYPAPPERVTDVSLLQGTNDTYVITFPKSDGNVSKYFILIKDHPTDILNSSDTLNTQIIVRGLIAGTTYSYSLYAGNGGGDLSTYTNGTFITNAAKSGPVSNLTVKEFTNTSVTLSWQKPTSPNGNITGYLLEVNLSGSCVDSYRFICNNCINAVNFDSNCSNIKNVSKSFEDLENIIQYTIQNLRPYRNYTFTIYAINEEGKGKESHIQQRTKPGTPENVVNIQTLVSRSLPNWVGLKVSWIPGELTGPTNYTVRLKERASINNDSFNIIRCSEVFVLEKHDNLTIEFPNLKAFWNYSVQIKATTEVGITDWVNSETVRTLTNTPGNATFQVIQDHINATKVNINITCPDENSRNGTILSYEITKRNMNDSKSENQTISSGINCPGDTTAELTGIEVEKMYSFTVVVKNQEFSSNESSYKTITIEPRKPSIDPTNIMRQGSVSTSSEVQVTLCVDCILDKSQGTVTKAGLAVCLEVPKSNCSSQSRRKRSTSQDYDNLRSWEKSKSNNFASEYRTTPDNWLQQLDQFRSLVIPYTIGNETSCKPGDFCNGPLPENTKMRVTIIVCTAAGCSLSFVSDLKTKAGPTDNVPAIVGGVVGGILGLALIAAVVFLIIYFKRRPGRSRPHSSPFMELDRQSREVIKEHRPIKITEFKDQVKRLHKDSNLLFQDEFEDIKKLSSRFLHTSDEAKKESNRVKNRYVDILPYDHSRVKLEVQPEDDETMDFVNANYIPGYNSVREYIATQGPMHCTVPDFWKMVWEQKSRVIVMLSDLTEQGKPKVTLYWPENLGEPINYGNVIVEMTNFSQLNKYIIRNFKLAKGSETRKVTHFFLPGWWDFSANLTTGDVLEFAQLVRQEATPANSGPIIVHCSAGVGRTGTFIALDYFMQYIERHSLLDSVDVFSYVMKMRNNRPRMVQAETQYIFIFDALDEVIDRKIKYEQEKMNEHIYNNGGGDLYANLPTKVQEDSIYANTEVIKKEKNGIDNKAFEADYENMSLMADKSETPTTVL